jgi:protein required for attachment to host cells
MVSQILIERNGKIILDLPIVAGAISAVIFTIPTVAGIIAAIATGCEIKIVKKDGGEINFNELSQEKFDEFMNKMNKEKKNTPDSTAENTDTMSEDESDFFVDDEDHKQ